MDVVLFDRLRKELSSDPMRAMLESLVQHGLPTSPPGGPALVHTREQWLESVYVIAIKHPDSEMRVCAMRTLTAISGAGIKSLREEDWYAWWQTREKDPPRVTGPGP